ncbi:MAG TPA: phosphopantetheine-binding protein, partial [Steroidobacteraceae bacterium]|nr:phosphopantetheine-binding protein [Steroidobacteraceae bacterium]
VAPRTATEQVLAEVWAEVLHLERVGIHDNFFELGGHSLLATQVIARVADRTTIELPLHDLFEAPTIMELARRSEIICAVRSAGSDAHAQIPPGAIATTALPQLGVYVGEL